MIKNERGISKIQIHDVNTDAQYSAVPIYGNVRCCTTTQDLPSSAEIGQLWYVGTNEGISTLYLYTHTGWKIIADNLSNWET